MDETPELRLLFHRLNNQLGIVLSHAELLEAKASDAVNRDRASQLVSGAHAALGTGLKYLLKNEPQSGCLNNEALNGRGDARDTGDSDTISAAGEAAPGGR